MAFSCPRRAKQDQIGALFEPAVAGGERHQLRLANHWHGVEVKAVEGLTDRQPGLGEMTFDAAAAALGDLMLGQGGEETGGRPAFLVGLAGEIDPQTADGGQPQLGQDQLDPGGVAWIGRGHTAPAGRTVASSSSALSGTSATVTCGMLAASGAKRRRIGSSSGSLPASSSAPMA